MGAVSLAKRAIEEFGAAQKDPELAALVSLLDGRELRRVLEIGTQDGGTLWLWSQLATPDARIISIDLDDAGGHRRDQQHVSCITADSHGPEMPARVRGFFEDEPLDLLFIDGDHTYDGVKADFEMYAPLVKPGGLIVLHDIVAHDPASGCEVDRFWAELKQTHPDWTEIVCEEARDSRRGLLPVDSCGIGVLWS